MRLSQDINLISLQKMLAPTEWNGQNVDYRKTSDCSPKNLISSIKKLSKIAS